MIDHDYFVIIVFLKCESQSQQSHSCLFKKNVKKTHTECLSSVSSAKTFFPLLKLSPQTHWLSLTKGFLSAPSPPSSLALCNSCFLVLYPESDDQFFSPTFFFRTDGLGRTGEQAKIALGNVPIPAVSEFSCFQLACLHPALCPEWRQQDFPASVANIWCLGLLGGGGGAPVSF